MQYKLGDIVEFEDKDWTIVDYDDINEQWVGEDSTGERLGFAEENLEEAKRSMERVANHYNPSNPDPGPMGSDPKSEPNDEFRKIKDALAKKKAAEAPKAPEPDAPDNKELINQFAGSLHTATPEASKKASGRKIKQRRLALTSKTNINPDDHKIPGRQQANAAKKLAQQALFRTNSYKETEENSIMDELEVGDVVVYEDMECLVIECDDHDAIVLESADGEQHTVSLDEMTKAAETIKGKASYNTSQMTANIIKTFASMPKDAQKTAYDGMMSQYGPGKDWGVGDVAGKNKASIAMKKVSEEDLADILAGEDLSEDTQMKAATLFEAAVNLRVSAVEAELKEFYAAEAEANVAEFTEHMEEQVDHYLSYVTENWIAENEVAVESNLKNELAESLISGLHDLLEQHYIDIPEQQVDVVEALASKVDQLEEQLNEQIESNIGLCEAVEQHSQEQLFNEVADGLAVTQVEKFRTLSEGVAFTGDQDDYCSKLEIIREKYFRNETAPSMLEEEVMLQEDEDTSATTDYNMDPNVARAVQAISRTQVR